MRLNLIFAGLLVIYNFFFWGQQAGLNLVLFSGLILVVSAYRNKAKIGGRFWVIGVAYLVSAIACLTFNSELSVFVLSLSSITAIGYFSRHASPVEAFVTSFSSFFSLKSPVLPEPVMERKRPVFRYISIAAFPLLVVGIYMLMFSAGNPVFKEYSQAAFGNFFKIFENISLPRMLFLALGILVLRWAFMKSRTNRFYLTPTDALQRKQGVKTSTFKLSAGLRKEFQIAMVLFVSLNLLFAVVNFIDVKYVWFQFHYSDTGLKDFLHEGFYWLILSLLISIGIVLYFFRQNLNFFPNNKPLKILAHLWIVQNIILALSVGLRCFYYIQYHGLAPGRITVIIFLSMVFFGLTTLLVKVARKRNLAWVLKVNSAAILLIFAASSAINWDRLTAVYNLNHYAANQIDVDHYLDLDPQVYPYLLQNFDKIEKQVEAHNKNPKRWVNYSDPESFKNELIRRSNRYLNQREKLKIYSWSYGDWKAVRSLAKVLPATEQQANSTEIEPAAS